MKILVFVILFVACEKSVSVSRNSNTFEELVCQQCSSWCWPGEKDLVKSRVGKAGPRGPPGQRGPEGVVNMTAIEEMIDEKIQAALLRLAVQNTTQEEKENVEIQNDEATQSSTNIPKSCDEVQNENAKARRGTGGLFDISFPGLGLMKVYCDTKTDGGKWTVFQRRMDGSVDFIRGWDDYVKGFGNKQQEFWLGLEAIHQMTKNGDHELRIDMIRTDGTQVYAKYRSFAIGPASDYYRLSISDYSGNTTHDRIRGVHSHSVNNMQFTTKDRDHDKFRLNCAAHHSGAWWHNHCTNSNLNGIFGKSDRKGILWYPHHMKFTEMKIRKKN